MFQSPVSPPPVFQPPVSLPTSPEDAHAPPRTAPEALPPEALRALDALLGEGRVVAHRACFGRLFGGAACGVLLSQFWFWAGTPTVRERASGWFWKPQREITEETGLSRAETATARRRLCAQGILEEKRCGIPATLHFRVDMAAVMRLLWAHLLTVAAPLSGPSGVSSPQTGSRGTRTLVRGTPASQFAGIAHSTSEIISEKTQEITQTRARPVLPSAFADRSAGRSAEGGLGAVVRAATGGAAISTGQQAVNLSGAARFKAALAAASRVLGREPP